MLWSDSRRSKAAAYFVNGKSESLPWFRISGNAQGTNQLGTSVFVSLSQKLVDRLVCFRKPWSVSLSLLKKIYFLMSSTFWQNHAHTISVDNNSFLILSLFPHLNLFIISALKWVTHQPFVVLQLFQTKIEERIPLLRELDARGRMLLEKSEEHDCVAVEEELDDFHQYCGEVISRLDRYHRRLIRAMVRDKVKVNEYFLNV